MHFDDEEVCVCISLSLFLFSLSILPLSVCISVSVSALSLYTYIYKFFTKISLSLSLAPDLYLHICLYLYLSLSLYSLALTHSLVSTFSPQWHTWSHFGLGSLKDQVENFLQIRPVTLHCLAMAETKQMHGAQNNKIHLALDLSPAWDQQLHQQLAGSR